jgi:hypothetical protein
MPHVCSHAISVANSESPGTSTFFCCSACCGSTGAIQIAFGLLDMNGSFAIMAVKREMQV